MSDPVFEAVTRAVAFGDYSQTAAAREALKPVRELHCHSVSFSWPRTGMCDECQCPWPCYTAKLAYTPEELER